MDEDKFSVDAPAKMPDDKVVEELIDVADEGMEGADDERVACLGLPPGMQVLYTTSLMDSEVNNGGFHQYFWNSSGATKDIALAGLLTLGDQERAALLRDAIRINQIDEAAKGPLPDKSSVDAFTRSEKQSRLGPLDDKYYKLKTDLSKAQLKYVRAHPEEFVSR